MSRVLIWVTVGIVTVLTAVLLVMQVLGISRATCTTVRVSDLPTALRQLP